MTQLTAGDRAVALDRLETHLSTTRDPIAVTRDELRAALGAMDDWIGGNAVAMRAALPLAAQTGLTRTQILRLLVFVMARRLEVG